ncbi:DNA-protecting protein DprA [Candidatus Giovannonibacteria bacterium]|nr:DNA-protecting protein DprA [Candidatus Giovannonibacteria bacterium]
MAPEKKNLEEIYFLSPQDKKFPQELHETPWPPRGLYVKGEIRGPKPKVAIVGTRRSTSYGKEVAFKIAQTLAGEGVIVVSGLALGIDAAAHEGALSGGGITWAVMGSGLENIYPKAHAGLAEKIIKQGGALISEYPRGLVARRYTFPERNRIVAGLAKLTIVIEAPEKSGALITARLALEAGREVGVVPGDVFRANFIGSNRLLREGAHPILGAQDALYLIGIEPSGKTPKLDKLDEIAESILQCLDGPKSADEIILATKLKPAIISQKLMELELKNIIKSAGGVWRKTI